MAVIMGTKVGMTAVYVDHVRVPVTVISANPNTISAIRDSKGYQAVQLAYGERKAKNTTKAEQGHLRKAGLDTARYLREFRFTDGHDMSSYELGAKINVTAFSDYKKINITSEVTKGKGFAGVIKRHNFKMQDATHGNSLSHRAHGSTGGCQDPGRVFPGKKMAGQMGAKRYTAKNIEVVKVDLNNNLILVKGAVPGANGGMVLLTGLEHNKVIAGDA